MTTLQAINQAIKHDGTTLEVIKNDNVTPLFKNVTGGYVVARKAPSVDVFVQLTSGNARDTLHGALNLFYDLALQNGAKVGIWHDKTKDKDNLLCFTFDLVETYTSKTYALHRGRLHKQVAIFNLDTFQEIYL